MWTWRAQLGEHCTFKCHVTRAVRLIGTVLNKLLFPSGLQAGLLLTSIFLKVTNDFVACSAPFPFGSVSVGF